MKSVVALLFLCCAVGALAGLTRQVRQVDEMIGEEISDEQAVAMAVKEEQILLEEEKVKVDEAQVAKDEIIEELAIDEHAPPTEIEEIREEIRQDDHAEEHGGVNYLADIIVQ